jgi:hypothetical protein
MEKALLVQLLNAKFVKEKAKSLAQPSAEPRLAPMRRKLANGMLFVKKEFSDRARSFGT